MTPSRPFRFPPIIVGTIAFLWLAPISFGAAEPTPDQAKYFNDHVRPVLQENCLKCHGGEKTKGGLRLTTRDMLLKGGDQGAVVVVENPSKSLLLEAINYRNDKLQMPPTGKLPADKIDILTKWVESGAGWPAGLDLTPAGAAPIVRAGPPTLEEGRNFWSFKPITNPAVPDVQKKDWVRNPIDAFILSKLEAHKFAPAGPVDRIALIRRVYYDLIGLPPTPAQVDAFVKDASPDAYEKVIDELLASPHYGEKWGRYWLDLVRYAETNSYERDNPKPNVWRFRDYVIRSFNDDKPYDRFVKEQIAGDELPDADSNPDDHIATGFYRLGIWDDEPSDREQARYEGLDDIVSTVGETFLGVTVGCARCHDHKIDPIPQKDYYRLLAFFQNINDFHNGGAGDELELFSGKNGRAAYDKLIAERKVLAKEADKEVNAIEADFAKLYEAEMNAKAPTPDMHDLRYRFYRDTWERLPDFAALKFESEGTLPAGLFDIKPRTRNDSFGFVFEGMLSVPADGEYTFFVDSDDGSRLTVDGKEVVIYDGIHGEGREKSAKISLKAGNVPIKLEYFQKTAGLGLNVGWAGPTVVRRTLTARKEGPADALVIQTLGERLLGKERFEKYNKLRTRRAQMSDPPPAERVLRASERGPEAPDTFVLARGSAHAPGAKVSPGFLSVVTPDDPQIPKPAPGAKSSGRRTVLANWLTAKENPLPARVMANRIWQYHFGRGIVRSPNNFGVQGDKPTHPELLDWLASQLVDGGWKLKSLHKLILTSNAYRMSSQNNPAALAADPRNDLFWRFDMRRLTAEEVRDSILAANGTLNLKMFGPWINPPIPAEVLHGQTHPGEDWKFSSPEEAARRSVYVHVKRSLHLPLLESFDSAETDKSCPVRFVTVQPTQALSLINSEFSSGEADKFAARLRKEAGDDKRKQVALALQLVSSREPTAKEIDRGVTMIDDLIQKDGAKPDVALRYFCLMAMNLNEFIYLD